jgi:hypothetical protein
MRIILDCEKTFSHVPILSEVFSNNNYTKNVEKYICSGC